MLWCCFLIKKAGIIFQQGVMLLYNLFLQEHVQRCSVKNVFLKIWDNYKIGVHFFEKIKGIEKKGKCANNFRYRLNFSKKNLKESYCQGNNFYQPKLARKVKKRQCRIFHTQDDVQKFECRPNYLSLGTPFKLH